MNRTIKEIAAALKPFVMPAVRGVLGILVALGILLSLVTFMCAPQINQHSKYDEASRAFLEGLERFGRDSAAVEGGGIYQNGSRILVSGKITSVNEHGLSRSEDVAGEYDMEKRQLMYIKIGRDYVYDRKRDGLLPERGNAEAGRRETNHGHR